MGVKEHTAQVKEWEKVYGKPRYGLRNFDPCDVRVCCGKCGIHRKHMSRHHKGAEFMFALHFPSLYAKRYIEFHKEDCVRLCSTCHKKIERLTKPLKDEFKRWIYDKGLRNVHPKDVEAFRLRIIARCDRWLAGVRGRPPKISSAA